MEVIKTITIKENVSSTFDSFHYMEPKVNKVYNYNNNPVDYWSWIIIAYELYYGRLPIAQGE